MQEIHQHEQETDPIFDTIRFVLKGHNHESPNFTITFCGGMAVGQCWVCVKDGRGVKVSRLESPHPLQK